MGDWTFITNHAAVLSLVATHPQITARELAGSVGITERAVRKIISELKAENYLSTKKDGRNLHYFVNVSMNIMRDEILREIPVGRLLAILDSNVK